MDQQALRTLEARLRERLPHMPLRSGVSLTDMTTLRLGGPADLLAEPTSPEDVRAVLEEAHALHVPILVIGHGSNMLVKDGGVRGLVLRLNRGMSRITVEGDRLCAQCGAMLGAISREAAEHGLGGLAFASGIPGTAGGAVMMNAGAYGGEMSQVVETVEGFAMNGTPFRYSGEEMAFGYRTSRLQKEGAVVTQVTFRLPKGDRDALLAEMAELNARRREKQPLDVPSAGSTFKRPAKGYASALIDQCGLKGYAVGGAQVSEKHAGFCVNRGGTAADFLALMAHVEKTVFEQTGILLEPEVRIVGEDAPTARV